jgi:putative DNA primase/helicase
MVTASETEEGRAWAESRIKQLTGGDPIAARYMRQDFFQYQPQFKLVFLGNHKPRISNPDEAMRRRFHIIPFNFKPPEVDKHLPEKLEQEYGGILTWMIQGCLDWQANGLIVPESVKRETDAYFADQDVFSQWLNECTEKAGAIGEPSSKLWDSWKNFAIRNGSDAKTQATFKESMIRAGFVYKDRLPEIRTRGYLGIKLKVVDYKDFTDPEY